MSVAVWDERAKLGARAGTDDLIAKDLEQWALLGALHDVPLGKRVLEIGCGRGDTARLVAKHFPDMVAVDTSPAMIREAYREEPDIDFRVGDLYSITGEWDCIYTQRCLINVSDQMRAFEVIADHLAPGGRYLSCECSQSGLDAINRLRAIVGLPAIEPPYDWHRYLRDDELQNVKCLRLVECREFSSTYYYLSRVVNARLAADRGEEPDYNDPINRLALELPSEGPYAQTRLWIWEKP